MSIVRSFFKLTNYHFVFDSVDLQYTSRADNGIDSQKNDYVSFNIDSANIMNGFLKVVSIKFCVLPSGPEPSIWVYSINNTGPGSQFTSYFMYRIPHTQISTSNFVQNFILPDHAFNLSANHYVGIGFGSSTGGSPCQVPAVSSFSSTVCGGADQWIYVQFRSPCNYGFEFTGFSYNYTVWWSF